jgi:hypothetical protein
MLVAFRNRSDTSFHDPFAMDIQSLSGLKYLTC